MDSDWKKRGEAWRRFALWEEERGFRAELEFPAAVLWMEQAWRLASTLDPAWDSEERRRSHWRHLKRVQEALASLAKDG